MKNKKLVWTVGILAVIAVVIAAAVIILKRGSEEGLQSTSIYGKDIYGGNIDNVESVYITSGSTGNIVKLDKEDISEALKILDLIELAPKEREYRTGWVYRLSVTADGKNTDMTFAGNICYINGKQYEIKGADTDEISDRLDKIYKNAEAEGD